MNILGIDGNFYMWRVFLTLRTNRPISEALPYAFLALICKDALRTKATHLTVMFDGPSVFRYDVYPEYKSDRKAKKEKVQLDNDNPKPSIYTYLDALHKYLTNAGVVWTQSKKHEADDLLMSLSKQWIDKYPNSKVTLGAVDKDLYQGLNNKVSLFNSINKPATYIRVKEAEDKKGVPIAQMIDYQTMLGDSIDSIPGFKGYGPAKVKSILTKYKSIKNWYLEGSNEDKLWLIKNQSSLKRNRTLVTMVTDCSVPLNDKLLILPKLKNSLILPQSYHDYMNFLYPKTKKLF